MQHMQNVGVVLHMSFSTTLTQNAINNKCVLNTMDRKQMETIAGTIPQNCMY